IRTNQQTTTSIQETTIKKNFNVKYQNTIFIHWVHETRLTGLKRSIHEIHNDIFKSTEHSNIRLVVGDQNNPNLDFELTRKRPCGSLLKDPLRIESTSNRLRPLLSLLSIIKIDMKKSTNGQHIRKQKHQVKKKYRHRKTISDELVRQFQQNNSILLVGEKTLSMTKKKKKYLPLYTKSNIDPTVFLSNYSLLSNEDFEKMLLTTATTLDIEITSFGSLLKIEEVLTFIRHLTQLINTSYYLQIQNEQWKYYYDLGMKECIWTGRVSKNMAASNSMSNSYGRSKVLIEQRQKKYQNDLIKINNDSDEYMTKMPDILMNSIDQIKNIINHVIHQDLYQLRMEIERRKTILKFDAYDHQLVQ
ncbi:unnamed protein product, partial [Adineta ricciae]